MKPSAIFLSSKLLLAFVTLSFQGISHAAQATYDADTVTAGAQDGGGGWNTTGTQFWNGATNISWPNTSADEAIFGAGNGVAGSVTVGTVTANRITFATPGSGNYSLSGGIITLAGASPSIVANAEGTVGSILAGTAGLTKTGTGLLRLTGSNTYTGPTLLNAGSVLASSASGNAFTGDVILGEGSAAAVLTTTQPNQFASGSALTFANGTRDAKFQLRGTTQTVAGLDSATANTLSILQNDESGTAGYGTGGGTGTLIVNNSSASLFDGIIRNGGAGAAGVLNLTKTGSGTLTILNTPAAATNSHTGTTTVGGGLLQFGNSTATRKANGPGTLQIDANGSALLWYANAQTHANTFSGTGKLEFRSNNSITSLGGNEHVITGTANNGYSGPITVTDSRLRVQTPASPLGNGSSGNTVTMIGNGQLMYNSAGTYNYPISLYNLGYLEGGAPVTGLPLGALRLELGAVQAGTVTLRGNAGIGSQDTGGVISGAIVEAGGSFGITKLGANKITLSGNNTYTGITAIRNGTLAIQGSSLTGPVILGDTASLGRLALGNATAAQNLTLGSITSTGLGGSIVGGNSTVPSIVTLNLATDTLSLHSLGGTGPDENQLSLVKNGAGTLVVTTSTSLVGSTTVNGGTLVVPASNDMAGPTTVADGAALVIAGSSTKSWQTTSLSLGTSGATQITINNFDYNSGVPSINAFDSLSASGTVTINVSGLFNTGTFPLISYPFGSTIGGSGMKAFTLGTVPRGVTATLVDAGGAVSIRIQAVNPLKWKGGTNALWDIDGTPNWTLGTGAAKYLEGDVVRFDDTATGTTSLNLTTTVVPTSVSFENSVKNYTLGGSGSISGIGTLNKSGSGSLTIANANTHTGITTVHEGLLKFGDGTTDGSITGPLVNNAGVVFNTLGTLSYSGTLGGYGEFITKIGAGTQILAGATGSNTYTGTFRIEEGALQIGDGTANGSIGGSRYEIADGARLQLSYATAAAPPWADINGAGVFALNSEASGGWGSPAISTYFTGTLRIGKGRLDLNNGSDALGGTKKIQVLAGAQFLAFNSALPYTTPIEIAGGGWGEAGYPNGLRLAAGNTAIWAGGVTLTADSGIMAQRLSNFTIGGSIAGPFQCEFYAGDPNGDSGTLNVAPAAAVRNSYGSTRINGRPAGSIVAGNAFAFSSGPLQVVNAALMLNGNSFDFANLSGTGGRIGNYNASLPAVLTVGSDNTSTSYTGVLTNGGDAALALVKTGGGTLTLGNANTYTGDTTVSGGVLSIASPYLSDISAVHIAAGARLNLATGEAVDTVGQLTLGGTVMLPGTYNAAHATYGSYFTGTGSLVVAGGYSGWAAAANLDATNNGPGQDPDHDGISNLLEFYLDGNPLGADHPALLSHSTDAGYLTLGFHRRDDAAGEVTSQIAQYGSDLTGWTDVVIGNAGAGADAHGVIVEVAGNGTAADSISIRIPLVNASGGKLFARLKIVR